MQDEGKKDTCKERHFPRILQLRRGNVLRADDNMFDGTQPGTAMEIFGTS